MNTNEYAQNAIILLKIEKIFLNYSHLSPDLVVRLTSVARITHV